MIEYIMVFGGLAMLRVLQAAFVASFKDRFALGALVSFLVTVADLAILNIGALIGFRGVVQNPSFLGYTRRACQH